MIRRGGAQDSLQRVEVRYRLSQTYSLEASRTNDKLRLHGAHHGGCGVGRGQGHLKAHQRGPAGSDGIASALNDGGFVTQRCGGNWQASSARNLLARLNG